ncbi:L-dopachrome tautomerase yellow-k [Cochliomyia hominivorax]
MISNILKLMSILIATQFHLSESWLLAQSGLNESYRVLHLSTHFTRVFLCITVKSHTFPTLIETKWPESYLPIQPPMIFPHRFLHANGDHTDCSLIQQAFWSQVDSLSRLWVMDIGWLASNGTHQNNCNPKLMVFDLLRNNVEVLHIDCGKYIKPNSSDLLDIELGPRITSCGNEKFIYFLLANDPHLLAYDILEQKWHYRLLRSKKYCTIKEFLPIKPQDITFGLKGEILISDNDGNLYVAANEMNRISSTVATNQTDNSVINMHLLGPLLGATRDMMVDPYGALFYVVSKFGAVVRCVYKQNMTAEDSEIIHMTSKNIQQIFFGSEGSVWLLSEKWLKPYDKCFSGY